jgi:hypothetical protein
MEKTLLLKLLTLLAYLLCFVTLSTSSSSATVKHINASKLKMFVDDLPNMPKVYGYKVVDGVPKSKCLKIGMFKKKWVCCCFCLISSLHANILLFCCLYCTIPNSFFTCFDRTIPQFLNFRS